MAGVTLVIHQGQGSGRFSAKSALSWVAVSTQGDRFSKKLWKMV
jgi:hypothetical protein